MFKLNTNGHYSWPVEISVPIDGGVHEKQVLDVKFKRLPQSKIQELLSNEESSDNKFCKEIIVGWKGVCDESGNEIPFSNEALDNLLDFPQLAKKIVVTYLSSLSESKLKN